MTYLAKIQAANNNGHTHNNSDIRSIEKKRKSSMTKSALAIILVAVIWAAVIFAAAGVLRGTPYWEQLLPILGGGAAATIIILGGTRPKKN